MNEKTGALVLFGALVLPYTTWIRWHYPDINESMRVVPLFIFTALAISLCGLFLSSWDRPLGLFCSYCGISALFIHTPLSLAAAHWILIGSALFLILRNLFRIEVYRKLALWGLITSAIIQSLMALLQFLHVPWVTYAQKDFMHGTLTHHNFLGAFLALIIPLTPILGLPVLFLGLLISISLTGFVASFVGLVKNAQRVWIRFVVSGITVVLISFVFWNKSHDSVNARLRLWLRALRDTDDSWNIMLFGKGLGSWYSQGFLDPIDMQQVFYQAHNEYLQLFYELGLVGLTFLVWFLYANRRMFKNGAFLSLVVCCSTIYVFHLVFLAVTAIIVMAICASEREEKCDDSLESSQQRLSSSAYYV